MTTAEDATSVIVHVSVRGPRLGWSGGDEAVDWPIQVRLDHPLVGRQVIGHTDALIPER